MADNPQAFPIIGHARLLDQPGMTLLDYFAGQALASIDFLRGDGSYSEAERKQGLPERHAEWIAIAAYRIARAMLNERQSHEG